MVAPCTHFWELGLSLSLFLCHPTPLEAPQTPILLPSAAVSLSLSLSISCVCHPHRVEHQTRGGGGRRREKKSILAVGDDNKGGRRRRSTRPRSSNPERPSIHRLLLFLLFLPSSTFPNTSSHPLFHPFNFFLLPHVLHHLMLASRYCSSTRSTYLFECDFTFSQKKLIPLFFHGPNLPQIFRIFPNYPRQSR